MDDLQLVPLSCANYILHPTKFEDQFQMSSTCNSMMANIFSPLPLRIIQKVMSLYNM